MSAPSPTARRRSSLRWSLLGHHHLVAGLVVLALVVALRIPGITAPLGIDEGGMSLIGSEWLRAATSGDAGGTSLYGDLWVDRPPLILAAYGAADLIGGDTAVRVMGLLAALAVAALAGTIASRVTGRPAWGPTALVTGVLLCSPAIDGDRTAGELLAAVPSAVGIALLAAVALRDRRVRDGVQSAASLVPRWSLLVLAGMAAAMAPLVKQSALDAFVAATLWFAWRAWDERALAGGLRRVGLDVGGFALGAATMTAVTVALAAQAAGTNVADLAYALIGFRVDVLEALASSSPQSPVERVTRLLPSAAGSGLLLVAFLAFAGLAGAHRTRLGGAATVLLGGWLLGAVIGVSGGGYYWAHYLIQLAAPIGACAGLVLAHKRRLLTGTLVGVLVAITVSGQVVRALDQPPQRLLEAGYRPVSQDSAVVIGEAVRRNSAPDDRVAVLYARANIAYYAHRQPATPYLWSSMYRALPEARADLLAALQGDDRATWVVAWQPTTSFGLDEDGAVRQSVQEGYRRVATLCGKRLYLRSDRPLAAFVLPAKRCPLPGPEHVTGARTVTRGFDAI